MEIFDRILNDIHSGMVFFTPVRKVQFSIDAIDKDRLVFFVGAKSLIPIPRTIWDEIPDFLRDKGWVRIGAKYDTGSERTLQEYIDKHPSRGTQHSSDANYVASVLEYLKIVDVIHSRPSKVKLK